MKFKILGDAQRIATSTSTGTTALSGNNLKTNFLLVQHTGGAAVSIEVKLGGSGISISDDSPIIHGLTNGYIIKRESSDTHIAHKASTGTPNLVVTPVNPL